MSAILEKLNELDIVLPEITPPVANYVSAVLTGNLLYLSGHTSSKPGRSVFGKVGADVSVEDGYKAARFVAIDMIASLRHAVGDLERVKRIVKLLGMVNAVPNFEQHPAVINGASDLLVAVFGERGRHARSAVGVGSLPGNAAVEIEMIVELEANT